MKTTGVENAIDEMDYEQVENSFGVTMPVSTPAQFVFTETAADNYDGIEAELDSKGLRSFREQIKNGAKRDGWYYNFEVIGRDYKRIAVKMWPNKIRIYPRENQPELTELAQITSAIESACGSGLEHSPIERGEADE